MWSVVPVRNQSRQSLEEGCRKARLGESGYNDDCLYFQCPELRGAGERRHADQRDE